MCYLKRVVHYYRRKSLGRIVSKGLFTSVGGNPVGCVVSKGLFAIT